MDTHPILVDGKEIDTGKYTFFPDMDKVITEPGLAIALQMRTASRSQRFVFSRTPGLIPKKTAEMRYLRDYRKHHGIPKYSNDELDDIIYAKVALSRESDISEAIAAGARDHEALFNPFRRPDMGVTLDERIDALYEAGLAVKDEFEKVREISVKEGVPIKTFEWTWKMFTEYLERETFELWGTALDIHEDPGRDGGKNYRFREPYGVSCLFTPYNSPLALGILSITSSILAGNSTILKPPSKVPLSTILLGRIFMKKFLDMDLPPGMLQLLTGGGKRMMNRFMSDSQVGAIVWYGDSDTGLMLWSEAVSKRIQMAPELAGSDASLVWGSDVDLEFAAKMIVKGRYLGSGQACMAIKRLLVQDTLHDDLLDLVIEEAEKLQVGRPSDPKVGLPPVGLTALYILIDQMEDAVAKGAKIETGGFRCNYLDEKDPAGMFYKPTVLTNVNQDMRIMKEEVFAPALPVMKVSSVDEAISIANASRFGLRSSIFTDDVKIRNKWVKKIKAAGVTLGQDHLYFDPYMPHLGGYKDSGIIGGKYFPEMLTRMKYVHIGPEVDFT
ncbi:MAG: putative Lactaldehyde dehydrogenase [Candidatus Thorarchaeota archaeon]|nr:MAG: putative Lactaldehyde dehydrogenase [Candidatus Thorarchaeota archaeon]